MYPDYEELKGFEEAEGLKELLGKWEILSANLEKEPVKAPILLPDLFVISESSHMTSRFVEALSSYLFEKKNLMEFYGDVRYFEFMMDYCKPEAQFSEFGRLMDEVKNCAGFRNVFKGLVHIDLTAWVGHQDEAHFINLLDYLAENTGDWMIILSLSASRRSFAGAMESVLSMFLRMERVELRTASTESYVEELSRMIGEYHFTLDDGARELLKESIDALKKSKYFDASYTMRLLCGDIVYELYSRAAREDRVLTAEDLAAFAKESPYISRSVQKAESGFSYDNVFKKK